MRSQRFFVLVLAICATSLGAGIHAPAAAQTEAPPVSGAGVKWPFFDAIGYGGLGFGLGLALFQGAELNEGLIMIGVTAVAGIGAGAMIGSRARAAIAQRGHIKRVHKVAAMGGMALAGSTIGALVSIPLIEGEGEGTFLGSDEKTFTILVLGGTALGSLFAWMNRDELPSLSLQVAPALVGEGRYGFQISVSY